MDTITNAQRKLEDLAKKLEHLKTDSDFFSPSECLTMSGQIRRNLLNNSDIASAGSREDSISHQIKTLLDDIQAYQSAIISLIVSKQPWCIALNNPTVVDFSSAKKDLLHIIEKELEEIKDIPDETLQLLEKRGIDLAPHISTLNRVRISLSEECYKVLLIGEYQSGKTTMLNALCGGRYLGDIGKGKATSAVPLSIAYARRDNFSIEWKTPAQLSFILSHLSRHFDDFELSTFDLESAEQRQYWSDKLEELRLSNDAPKQHDVEVKFLSLSALILKYYDSPEHNAFKDFRLNSCDIPSISRFPEKLEKRWMDSGAPAFSFRESVFVLAYRIHCYCESEQIRKLNCSFIDCPGLFYSAYDSEVTEEAMTSADAIVYVLPYNKQLGEQINNSLRIIKEKYPDFHRKLLIVGNLSMTGDEDFYEANKDIALSMFDSKVPIIPLDALMAYYGAVKDNLENGSLFEEDIRSFIERSTPSEKSISKVRSKTGFVPFRTFSEAWDYKTASFREYYRLQGIESPDYLTLSNYHEFINELLRFIEKNKAYSLVYSNGIYRMGKELSLLRKKVLVSNIEPYATRREEIIALWDKRVQSVRKVSQLIKPLIDEILLDDNFIQQITDSSFPKVLGTDDINSMLDSICRIVYSEKRKLFKLRNDKTAFEQYLTPLIKKEVTSTIERRIKHWNDLVDTEQDSELTRRFLAQVEKLRNRLEEYWKKEFLKDKYFAKLMPDYLFLPTGTKDLHLFQEEQNGANVPINSGSLLGAMAAHVGVIAATIATALGAYISAIMLGLGTGVVIAASNPVGWIIALITLGGASVTLFLNGDDAIEDAFVKQWMPRVKEEYQKAGFSANIKDLVFRGLQKSIGALNIEFDFDQLKREKVLATATPENEREDICFKSVEIVDKLNYQLEVYKEFINDNIKDA